MKKLISFTELLKISTTAIADGAEFSKAIRAVVSDDNILKFSHDLVQCKGMLADTESFTVSAMRSVHALRPLGREEQCCQAYRDILYPNMIKSFLQIKDLELVIDKLLVHIAEIKATR